MNRTVLFSLLSHWRRKPGQLATLLIGLSLATALWTSVQAINAEARASYDLASITLAGGAVVVLTSETGTIPLSTFATLRRDGWSVSPVIEGELVISGETFTIRGVEPLSAATRGGGIAGPTGNAGGPGVEFFSGRGVLLASPETAAALEASELDLPPILVGADIPRGEIVTDIGVAAQLLNRGNTVDALLLDPEARAGLTPLGELAPELEQATGSASGEVSRLAGSFHLNLTAFGLLSFAVGLFIVYAAVGLGFEQRRGTLRTLRALGAPVSTLIPALILEVLVFALVAGAIGVVLGYAVASALLPDVAATLRGLYGADVSGALSIRPEWWLSGFAIATLGALGATAQSIFKAARLPLLASAQPRAWAIASARRYWLQTAGAGVLFLTAILIPNLASGVVAGFALMASLLFGAALLLPPVLALALKAGQRVTRGPVAEWFMADTRQQLPGLSMALMALMLALATNIGVGTMVSSFRLTFEGWLDQRLASELYVTTRDESQSADVRAFLEERADAVLPIWSVETELGGRSGELFGVVDHSTYRDLWPLIVSDGDAWDAVMRGEGLLLNEQTWRRMDIPMGTLVDFGAGPPLPLVGAYTDYGNPNAQAIIGIDILTERYGEAVSRLRYGIRIDPERAEALTTELLSAFDLPANGIIDQASIKEYSRSVFDRTFAVTAALNVLTLSVAAFAMFASLTTLAAMRLPQLAPLWALGLTRARLAQLELVRAVVLALLTWLVALPTGLMLAWALLMVVNVEAFGWQLPMYLFPADWVRLAGLATLAAVIAAALPARALSTQSPRAFLQTFAQER